MIPVITSSISKPKLMIILGFGLAFAIILSGGCHYYKLERNLDPVDRQWLDEVNYIITSEERKIFLELPDSDRETFKEEFWLRRDPDLGTEENEFKMEYYDRIDQANELFFSEGREGYKTDRGKIYILFGPPTDKLTQPETLDGLCQEIWYYGNFPVVFQDRFCTGTYKLITYDLTSLQSQNLAYVQAINKAQDNAAQTIVGEAGIFNFEWQLQASLVEPKRVEGQIDIEVPLASIWFQDISGEMVTHLDVHVEMLSADEQVVWSFVKSYEVKTNEVELQENQKQKYRIQIPFVISDSVERLQSGVNKVLLEVMNRTGETKLRKLKTFRLNEIN